MDSLSTRLNKLRTLHDTDISTKEDKTIEFPLWALLIIYEKAHHRSYINYNEGFKVLVDWLSPITYTPKNTALYNRNILVSYEVSNIGRMLNVSKEEIYECVFTEVIPRLRDMPRSDWDLNDEWHRRERAKKETAYE